MPDPAPGETTPPTGTEPGSGTPSEPKTVTLTQDRLDAIIASRVAETKASVTAQFGDYGDLKARAAKADELEAANLSELERAQRERDEARATAAKATEDSAKVLLDAQRALVAAQAGLPPELAELLKGGTKEELEAHAETLKPFVAPKPAEPEPVGGGQRREDPQSKGMSRDEVIALAKKDPAKLNDMLDKGDIKLAELSQ